MHRREQMKVALPPAMLPKNPAPMKPVGRLRFKSVQQPQVQQEVIRHVDCQSGPEMLAIRSVHHLPGVFNQGHHS